MIIDQWPEQLPCGMHEGYSLSVESRMKRTPMESGRARVRHTFRRVPVMANVSWIMTPQQAQIFETWFIEAANGGASWVKVPLLTPADGDGDATLYKCRFVETYEGPSLVGNRLWKYSAILEIEFQPVLRGAWYLLPEYMTNDGKSIFDIAMNDRWPEQ